MQTIKIALHSGNKNIPCSKIDGTIEGNFACHKPVPGYLHNRIFDNYVITHLPTGRLIAWVSKEQALEAIKLFNQRLSFRTTKEANENKLEIKGIIRNVMKQLSN